MSTISAQSFAVFINLEGTVPHFTIPPSVNIVCKEIVAPF